MGAFPVLRRGRRRDLGDGYRLGAYFLEDSLHRPTGPLDRALALLVLCLFVNCIVILLRTMRRFEDEAERMLPGPLDPDAGKNAARSGARS
jgi:hypothetical protein